MKKPGYSFPDMAQLVWDNNWQLYHVFPDELLLAIFWEETLFNNIAQPNGTAVGFGQVEPAELWKLKKYGISTSAKAVLNDPAHAVDVSACYLRHLYESQTAPTKSRYEALKRYAGWYFDKAAWRLKVIAGWEACEKALLAVGGDWRSNAAAVTSALSLARGIDPADTAVRGLLFP